MTSKNEFCGGADVVNLKMKKQQLGSKILVHSPLHTAVYHHAQKKISDHNLEIFYFWSTSSSKMSPIFVGSEVAQSNLCRKKTFSIKLLIHKYILIVLGDIRPY